MSTDEWLIGLDGNWSDPTQWTSGVPTLSSDVIIDAFNSYTVSVTGPAFANSLTIEAPGVTFSESASGSLDIAGNFFIENSGTVILRGTNTIGGLFGVSNSTLEIGNAAALGTGELEVEGEMIALANMKVQNQIAFGLFFSTIAAAHGKTLTLANGNWIDGSNGISSLTFGSGNNDGTVVWDTITPSTGTSHLETLEVAAGTLQAGDANFHEIFDITDGAVVDVGGKLNLAGQSITISNLSGYGLITSGQGTPTLTLTTPFTGGIVFAGSIRNAIAVDIASNTTFTGANTYTGGTTIESGKTLTIGNGGTTGTIAGNIANSGNLIFDRSDATSITATIGGTSFVTYEGGGTFTLNGPQSYTGETFVENANVIVGNASAFGTGTLAFFAGTLLATNSMTLAAQVSIGDDSIAAAHGTTLTLNAAAFEATFLKPVIFGFGGHDGTIVITGNAFNGANIDLQSGILRAGDATGLTNALNSVESLGTTVETGATIDWAGFNGAIKNLLGTGTVNDTGGTKIVLDGANFDGTIKGGTALEIAGAAVFGSAQTYTGGTTIDAGGTLCLGAGGTAGSVVGDITDNGTLMIFHSNTFNESALISGNGNFVQRGPGVVTIDRAELYVGGTVIDGGTLSIDRPGAIGTGALSVNGGEFLVTKSLILKNALSTPFGTATFAAANGQTLTLDGSSGFSLDANRLRFGDNAHKGDVVWHTPSGSSIADPGAYTVEVRDGTLKAADAGFSLLTGSAAGTVIDAAGTLNTGPFAVAIAHLSGSGVLRSIGTIELDGATFSGQIAGTPDVRIGGSVTLSGSNSFTGEYELLNGSLLTLTQAANQNVTFDAIGTFVLPKSYTGTIDGFIHDNVDVLDFTGLAYSGATEHFSGNNLTVTSGTHHQTVTLANEGYTDDNFVLNNDSHGGTYVTFVTAPVAPPLASDHPPPSDFG